MNMQYQLLHEERLREMQRNLNHEALVIEALGARRKPVRQAVRYLVMLVSQQVGSLKNRIISVRRPALPATKPGFPRVNA